VIFIDEERKGVAVQAALRWSRDSYVDNLQGFANGIRTGDGGAHLDGLKSAVTKTVNAFARKVSNRRVL
jgi:DNA gyrase subunit B